MRTTTIVFKFTPESSPAELDAKIEYFNSLGKQEILAKGWRYINITVKVQHINCTSL